MIQFGRPVEILLVEDNRGDVLLTLEAFNQNKISNRVHVAMDGEEAVNMLRTMDAHGVYTHPDIVLLDLNLPKCNGREVLKIIKQDEILRHIPVVVLTGSNAERDVLQSNGLHADGYIIKPVNLEKLAAIIAAIKNMWFTIVVLPEHVQEALQA